MYRFLYGRLSVENNLWKCYRQLSSPLRDASHGLSKFEMDEVSISVSTYNDRAMDLKCALQAVTLFDIREESSLAVRK